MKDRHLQLILSKTELLVFPANLVVPQNTEIQLGLSSLTPTYTAQNVGVMIDDQLISSEHVTSVSSVHTL